MKNISTDMQNHLNGEILTLSNCWKITRRDGVVMGFTDHDQALIIDDITYQAKTGFTPTAIINSSSLNVDNLDIEGMINHDEISEADIIAGLYDYAEVEMFCINYMDLSSGKIVMRFGWIGEVRFDGNNFVAELRGLTQKLSGVIGELYSPTCRANLGDDHCKVNITSSTVTGAISAVGSNNIIYDSARTEVTGTFTHGRLSFTSGANAGLAFEVKSHAAGQIKLMLPPPYAVEIGDTYSLTQGCDKRFNTCITRFNNAVNFRGEPHLIGLDRLLETSSTRN
jgi:uncharacterized phage protein (TIGR02218 family)